MSRPPKYIYKWNCASAIEDDVVTAATIEDMAYNTEKATPYKDVFDLDLCVIYI